jgi:hypothetical protein
MGKIYLGNNEIKKIYFGINEVKKVYLGSTEVWSASRAPDWLIPGWESKLALIPEVTPYYVDVAFEINSNTQYYYRAFTTQNVASNIARAGSVYATFQTNYSSAFRGWTTYVIIAMGGNSWGAPSRESYNEDRGRMNADYSSNYPHKAIIKSTITTFTNNTGQTFEDYRT